MADCGVHPNTNHPDEIWNEMKATSVCKKVQMIDPRRIPVGDDKVRFVCISDTHTQLERVQEQQLETLIPAGDVLLHAGDFTNFGSPKEVYKFNSLLGTLPHRYKIVIAGNHDVTFDDSMLSVSKNLNRVHTLKSLLPKYNEFLEKAGVADVRDLLTNCTYLQDSGTDVYGIKIHGSPWTPRFHWWGFNAERGQDCLSKWNLIPSDTDVVMTHGPPLGHGDYVFGGHHVGCVELLTTLQQRIKPTYHVFGHIHEGYGTTTDGTTTYINASTCNLFYRAVNPAIVFDFPLPPGVSKSNFNRTK